MDRLEFHVVQDRQLIHHDDIVLLFHETSDTKDKGHVLDPSHVHYRIVHIAGSVLRLDFVALLHTNRTRSGDAGDMPPKLTITICNEYILLRTWADGNQQQHQLAELQSTSLRQAGTSSSSSGTRSLHRASQWTTSETDQSRPIPDGTGGAAYNPRTLVNEMWPTERTSSRGRHLDDDERSEDSDTRKHTKTSSMEVLGKHAVHDDILRTTAVRTLMEKDRLKKFITAARHGYFENNFTEKNIIQGMLKYDPMGEDSTHYVIRKDACVCES